MDHWNAINTRKHGLVCVHTDIGHANWQLSMCMISNISVVSLCEEIHMEALLRLPMNTELAKVSFNNYSISVIKHLEGPFLLVLCIQT